MTERKELNEAARLMGRKGGLKGGRARAEALSSKRRSAIARLGAAKVNGALAQLDPAKRSRLIMRRRTWTAYTLGRAAALGRLAASANPYERRAFLTPLHDAWLRGFETLREPFIPFSAWRWTTKKKKKGGAR